MYSMVMMMAMAGSGDVASFGGRMGCHGGSSCCGNQVAVSSCGCHGRVGLFAGRHNSCCGAQASCCAPAPTCCAPAPVCAPAPTCCAAPVQSCCNSGCNTCCKTSKCGLFGGRRARHNDCGCNTCGQSSCCGAAPVSCCGGAVTMPAAEPAKDMPKPMGETPKKKDN